MATRLKSKTAGAVTALGLLAIAVVGNYEGLRLKAYKDVIGVWTACYGETKGIKPGMRFTKEQCDIIFIESLQRHEAVMRSCLNNPDGLPEKTYVAFLSLTYNIGGGGFCRSSVARAANGMRLKEACNNLLKFNKAGGRVIKGLVTRRNQERKLCLQGVAEGK
jgi:lysozyme